MRNGQLLELRQFYKGRTRPVDRCMAAFAATPIGYRVGALPAIIELEKRIGRNACTAFMAGMMTQSLTPASAHLQTARAAYATAMQVVSDMPDPVIWHSGTLHRDGAVSEAERTLRSALQRWSHPLHRLPLLGALREHARLRNDTTAIRAVRQQVDRITAADSRPGVLMAAHDVRTLRGAEWSKALRQQVELARRAKAAAHEIQALLLLGNRASDEGNTAQALVDLNAAVLLAERPQSRELLQYALRLRGRALSKTGDLTAARRDLERAIALYPVMQDDYELAEVYHNLAHVHESSGDLVAAERAVKRFVDLTRPFKHAQPRMMSLHDAAEIRWKAGWHAAASDALDEMVAVVDSQQWNHYWAGDYFERRGDYARAKAYYAAGLRSGTDISLNYGGLARIYEALGVVDSADAAARQHDVYASNQLDVPMQPELLMRLGRAADAIRVMRAWTDRKIAQKHVQGAARALNALAELYLQAGRHVEAMQAAQSARQYARQLNLSAEHVTAIRLQGLAELRAGQRSRAIAALKSAVAASRGTSDLEVRRQSHLALADAYAGENMTQAALTEYARAATGVDTIAAGLAEDVTRARFRSRQNVAFDGAVTLLLRAPQPDLNALIEWSQRRKAAALTSAGKATRRPRTLKEIQQQIAAREVVVDYIALDTAVAAIVISRDRIQLVRLESPHRVIEDMVMRLRAPMLRIHAGRIDLARTPYDLGLAHTLYKSVLAPVLAQQPNAQLVTVIPDGAVHGVPFDALVTRPGASYAGSVYVVDALTVREAPSLALFTTDTEVPANARVLAVSRDAPGGEQEVARIKAAFVGARVRTLKNGAATEDSVQLLRTQFPILHFATHAQADERDALRSHLRLGASPGHDGYLHSNEIPRRGSNSELVVLSACETKSGPLFPGEGVMGLSRAFLASGAQNVIATNWPIGAATAELMGALYTGLAARQSVATALRNAKLELRRDARTAHPFYWASFVLVNAGSRGTL